MRNWKTLLAGGAAGAVNGLLGAGGGMVLVPLLSVGGDLQENQIFPASVAIILPLCIISLTVNALQAPLPWRDALPYLIGSIPGGLLAGALGKHIPTKWLHRALALVILWGGIRYLWP